MTRPDTKGIVLLVACLLGRPVSRHRNGHEDMLGGANVEEAYFLHDYATSFDFFSFTICSRPSCFLISPYTEIRQGATRQNSCSLHCRLNFSSYFASTVTDGDNK
jgi:hypothetical protein